MSKKRQDVKAALNRNRYYDPTGDSHRKQVKDLSITNSEISLELIEVLERLDESNRIEAQQNRKLQQMIILLAVVTVATTLIGLLRSR